MKKRVGYRNVAFQMPEAIFAAIEREADRKRKTWAATIVEALRRAFKVPLKAIPPPRRTGRKPKRD